MKNKIREAKNILNNPTVLMFFMLIISFLSQIFIFYDLMRPLRYLVLIWGMFLILEAFLCKRDMFKNKYGIIILAFCFINYISVVLNYSGRFFYGVVTMVYVSIFLLLFFFALCWKDTTIDENEKWLDRVVNLIIWFSFATAVIALLMFVFNIVGVYQLGDSINYYGMRHNRLWGVYNANTAVSICMMSIACSLYKMQSAKTKFLWVNIVIQYIYLVLTQSRTGWILLIGFSILYALFMIIIPAIRNGTERKGIVKTTVYCIVFVVCLACSAGIAKKVLIVVPKTVIKIEHIIMKGSISEEDTISEENTISLERIDEDKITEEDVTNGRGELWSAGLKLVKQHPIFGIGCENVIIEAEQYLSAERYENLVKGGFHNSFIAIWVSAGFLGLGAFLVLIVMLLWDGFRYLFFGSNRKYMTMIILLFTLMANELLEARWLYNTSFNNIIFWVLAGMMTVLIEKELKKIR